MEILNSQLNFGARKVVTPSAVARWHLKDKPDHTVLAEIYTKKDANGYDDITQIACQIIKKFGKVVKKCRPVGNQREIISDNKWAEFCGKWQRTAKEDVSDSILSAVNEARFNANA